MSRPGFGLAEVAVALTVLAVGALGAAALIAHAALSATAAKRTEEAVRYAVELLDSLVEAAGGAAAGDAPAGERVHRAVTYQWSARGDSAHRVVEVMAVLRAPPDTIRLSAARPPVLPVLIGDP